MPHKQSRFYGFNDVADDATITVETNREDPQVISVWCQLPDFSTLPHLCLTLAKAHELREALAEVLDGIEETP